MSTPPLTVEQQSLLLTTVGRGMSTLGANSINGLTNCGPVFGLCIYKTGQLYICPHHYGVVEMQSKCEAPKQS